MAVEIRTSFDINDYLDAAVYSCDKVAMDADENWIDPIGGRADCLHKTLKTIANPKDLFKNDPLEIMSVIRHATSSGFFIDETVQSVASRCAGGIRRADKERIRDDFEAILTSDNAGYGLEMIGKMDVLQGIIGLKRARIMRTRELRAYKDLWEEMDRIPNNRLERIGMFYLCFEGRGMLDLAKLLPYDEEVLLCIEDAEKYMPKMSMISKLEGLEKLIDEIGVERYEYIDSLAYDQAKAYGLSDKKIQKRRELFKQL